MKIKGKMLIDLSPIGGSPQYCQAELSLDPGTPRFEAVVTEPSSSGFFKLLQGHDPLSGKPTEGELDDGRHFEAQIVAIPGSSLRGRLLTLSGRLDNVRFSQTEDTTSDPSEWVFRLTNIKLYLGDVKSEIPLPENASPGLPPGSKLDSIVFSYANRSWRLTDDNFKRWRKIPWYELASPQVSGTIRTDYRTGDVEEQVWKVVQDLCDLLAVALSRAVNWVSFELRSVDGETIRSFHRAAWTTGFNRGGMCPLDNFGAGVLKTFIERAQPIVSSNRELWKTTLGILSQAQIAEMVDVRCSLLYTLLDRISDHIVATNGEAEIDPELKKRARAKKFIAELHAVLGKLSVNWDCELTNRVLGEIKRWNKMPTYATKIRRACQVMRLPEPEQDFLNLRHGLLHDGEYDPSSLDAPHQPSSDRQLSPAVKHWIDLDWWVLALVLRLLEYEGPYYHPKFGHQPVDFAKSIEKLRSESRADDHPSE